MMLCFRANCVCLTTLYILNIEIVLQLIISDEEMSIGKKNK